MEFIRLLGAVSASFVYYKCSTRSACSTVYTAACCVCGTMHSAVVLQNRWHCKRVPCSYTADMAVQQISNMQQHSSTAADLICNGAAGAPAKLRCMLAPHQLPVWPPPPGGISPAAVCVPTSLLQVALTALRAVSSYQKPCSAATHRTRSQEHESTMSVSPMCSTAIAAA